MGKTEEKCRDNKFDQKLANLGIIPDEAAVRAVVEVLKAEVERYIVASEKENVKADLENQVKNYNFESLNVLNGYAAAFATLRKVKHGKLLDATYDLNDKIKDSDIFLFEDLENRSYYLEPILLSKYLHLVEDKILNRLKTAVVANFNERYNSFKEEMSILLKRHSSIGELEHIWLENYWSKYN